MVTWKCVSSHPKHVLYVWMTFIRLVQFVCAYFWQEHRSIPYLECMQYYKGNATASPKPSTILSVEPMKQVSPVSIQFACDRIAELNVAMYALR